MCQGGQGLKEVIRKKGAKDKQLSLKLYSESGACAEGNILFGGEGAMLANDQGKAETPLTESSLHQSNWPLHWEGSSEKNELLTRIMKMPA